VPEENRNIHLKKIIQELDKWGISYTILSGDYDYRTSVVEQYVEKWLMKEEEITS
jgi:NifB/MoaA-like Fe-S oxidoreductase